MSNIPPELLREYQLGLLTEEQAEEVERQLAEQTARQGETIQNLEVAEDTLVMGLRQPLDPDPLLAEPQLDSVLRKIDALGRDQSLASIVEPEAPLETLGAYQLLEKLGEGGMGTVYKALHTRLKKVVALKVLPTERLQNTDSIARFEREMEAAGRLDHPHLIRAMDAGEFEGRHFLVMEYVEGFDLGQLSQQCGPLPTAEACELIRQAALGLQDAFEHGLVHRDIKPSNLFLAKAPGKEPIVKVLDLGLARLADAAASDLDDLTTDGQIMGTLDYMAPEQGGDTHNVDIRADIYALGATLYKLLTGSAVYSGESYRTTIQKLTALVTEPAPPITSRRGDIPAGLADLVHRMLEKSPTARPATPREVAELLAPFTDHADLESLANGTFASQQSAVEWSVADDTFRLSATTATETPPLLRTMAAGNSGDGGRFKRWKWIAGGVMAASLLLGVILLQLRTPRGTIVVEIAEQSAAEIETRFADGGIEILDKQNDRVWSIQTAAQTPEQTKRLPDGTYQIRTPAGLAIQDSTGAKFETDQFELRGGEQVRLRVVLEPLASKSPDIDHMPAQEDVAAQESRKASASELDSLDWSKLKSLQLDISDLTKDGWEKLARGIHLEDLELNVGNANQPSFSQTEIAIVAGLPKLRRLSLPTSIIGLEAGDAFKASESIRELVFTGPPDQRFTEIQADAIWGIPNLSAITWIGTIPTNATLEALLDMPQITHLSFQQSPFSDGHLNAVAKFPRLTHLDLQRTNVRPLALDKLRESRNELQISGDVPRVDYAAEREVAQWLLEIPAQSSSLVVQLRSDSKQVKISQDSPLPDEPFIICHITMAEAQAPQGDWSPLTRLSGLKRLTMHGASNFTDASLSKLSNFRNTIEEVLAFHSHLRGPGFSVLAGAPRLNFLHLIDSGSLNDTAMIHFATLPKLKFLNIGRTQVTDAGLERLAEGQPPIGFLELPSNTKITVKGMQAVSRLKSLTHLALQDQLKGEDLRPILNLPELEGLTMPLNLVTKDNFEVLKDHPNLKTIQVIRRSWGLITDAPFLVRHHEVIRVIPNLQNLGVSVPLSPEAAECLAEFPELKEMTVDFTELTPQILDSIANAKKLVKLFGSEDCTVTKSDFEAFQAKRPDIEVIGLKPTDP